MRGRCTFSYYIAHFPQKSKLYGGAKTNFSYAKVCKSQSLVNEHQSLVNEHNVKLTESLGTPEVRHPRRTAMPRALSV
jgi:hypothetical protein